MARARPPVFVAGLVLGLLLATSLRALLSTLFYESLVTLRLNESALWTLVLLAPALAASLPRTRVPILVAGAATAALPLTRFTEAYVPIAALAAGAALLALAQVSRPAIAGALVGVALGGASLLASGSHDPLLSAWAPGVLVPLTLVALLARPQRPPAAEDAPSTPWRLAGVAVAMVLAVELAYLASPYALARHAQVEPWLAALAGAGGFAAGATLLPPRSDRWLPVAGAVGLLDLALGPSPLILVSIVALQAALGAAVARLPRPEGAALGFAFAPIAFALLYFSNPITPGIWLAVVPLLCLVPLLVAFARTPLVRVTRPRRRPVSLALVLVALLLLVVPGATPTPIADDPHPDELVVVSWNVHQGFGNRGALDPQVYVDALRGFQPDILLLQEADTTALSSAGLDMTRYLADALGLHALPHLGGTAILSRYPLADAPAPPDEGWAVELPLDVDGHTVWVESVHLSRSPSERAVQAQALLDAVDARPGLRILGGDLNSCPAATCFGGRPSDNLHAVLAPRYQDAWSAHHAPADPAGNTHPARDPSRRIDVVMTVDLEIIEAYPVRDEPTRLGSDHLPVLARLRMPTAAS